MSNLKCPFCQQELFYTYQQDGIVSNPNKGKVDGVFCDNCKMYGNETIWERLDRTRKALDVATKYIKHTQKVSPFWFNRLANETLDKIKTALEQKE